MARRPLLAAVAGFVVGCDAGSPDNLIVTSWAGLDERPEPGVRAQDLKGFTQTRDVWVLIVRHDPDG